MKKKLIIFNAVIITVGFIITFLCAAVQIQKQYQKEFTNRLDTALAILSTKEKAIAEDPKSVAAEVGSELAKSGQQIRISIIDVKGKVIGDSAKDEIDQNHLSRPEIQQALKSGKGADTRMSASIHQKYYYEAVYVPGKYFLRAALPVADLDAAIGKLWQIAALSMFLGIVLVCLMTGFLVYHTAKPLKELTDAAEKISGGDYSCRVGGTFKDEVGQLAKSFNAMARNTENAVSQLKSQQSRLEGVLQGMDDGVLAIGKGNEILFLNQSARRLLENENLSVGNQLAGSLLINKIAAIMKDAVEKNSVTKQSIAAEQGKQFTVYTAPIPGQKTASALAVLSDVTRLRKLERLRSEFVANVTHELKTPLTSIRGSIDLLKSADRDEKTRRYFYDVLDIEAERLQNLIDDMLTLSQIENAKEDPTVRPCSVKEAVQKCIERIQPAADKNQIKITVDMDDGLLVLSSPTRLQQLFGNLIENAVKYNVPRGNVTITAIKQKKTVIVHVSDTGIGIAKEHFGRLFERFYRVDASRSREIGGTGLGLSIVKHLAVLYGGEVSVESEVGKGSVFTVRLPLTSGQ